MGEVSSIQFVLVFWNFVTFAKPLSRTAEQNNVSYCRSMQLIGWSVLALCCSICVASDYVFCTKSDADVVQAEWSVFYSAPNSGTSKYLLGTRIFEGYEPWFTHKGSHRDSYAITAVHLTFIHDP